MDTFAVLDGRPVQFGVIQRRDIDTDKFRALTKSTRLLYITLLTFIGRYSGKAWPKTKTLSRITGISKSTTFRGLKALKDDGFISIERRKQGNLYTLLDPSV